MAGIPRGETKNGRIAEQVGDRALAQRVGQAVGANLCRVILCPHDAENPWSETFLSAMRAYPDPSETVAAIWPVRVQLLVIG